MQQSRGWGLCVGLGHAQLLTFKVALDVDTKIQHLIILQINTCCPSCRACLQMSSPFRIASTIESCHTCGHCRVAHNQRLVSSVSIGLFQLLSTHGVIQACHQACFTARLVPLPPVGIYPNTVPNENLAQSVTSIAESAYNIMQPKKLIMNQQLVMGEGRGGHSWTVLI